MSTVVVLFENVSRTELDSANVRLKTNPDITVFIAQSGWTGNIYVLTHTNPDGGNMGCRTSVLEGEHVTLGSRPGRRTTVQVVRMEGKTYLEEDVSWREWV
jgi:hypothetical protein